MGFGSGWVGLRGGLDRVAVDRMGFRSDRIWIGSG